LSNPVLNFDTDVVRAEPFDAIEIPITDWWPAI